MDINQIISQAEQAHSNGQLAQAEALYQNALNHTVNVDALYGLATIKMQQGQTGQALDLFAKAHNIEPCALDITFNYLLCLKQAQQIDKARQLLASIVNAKSMSSEFIEPYAQLAFSLNAYQQTITIISASLQPSPNLTMLVAQSYIALQNWAEAIVQLQKLNQQFPNNIDILNNLAICYGKTLNFIQAIPVFEQLITLKPTNENYLRLVDLYLLAQDKNAAERTLNLLKAKGFENLSITELECKIARLNHDKTKAIALSSVIIEKKPNSSIAWQVIGELGDELAQQQLITTLSDYFKHHNIDSFDDRQNLYTLAKALEKQQQFEQAFNIFEQANTSQRLALANEGKSYQPASAERVYEHLKQIDYPSVKQVEHPINNVFIVGMPRSGTTLVNRLLSQVPNSKSVNESNGISAVYEQRLINTPANQINHLLSSQGEQLSQQYQRFVGVNDKLTIDKMPHNFRFVGAILSTFKAAKIIQMRRAPQDLALSIYSQQFNDYHNYACDLAAIAHAITQANELMDFWQAKYPTQVYDLDYQRLVEHPAEEAQKLFEFLEITWQPDYLNFYQQAVPSFTFSEVQVRQPINTGKIGFSKHYHEQLKAFREAYKKFSK